MRAAPTFRVGLIVGLVGGGLGGWLGGRIGGALLGKEQPKARSGEAGSRTAPGAGQPGLSGREAQEAAAANLKEETAKALRALEGASADVAVAGGRGLAALATFYAVAGNEDEFLRLAEGALARGLGIDDLLASLREFPVERRGAILAILLDRHPGASFEPVGVAKILAESGESKRALGIVRQALPRQGDFHPDLARLLMRLDPEGGPTLLFGLEGAAKWDDEALGVLRAVLIEADREDRMLPFLERALDERPGDHDALHALRRLDAAAASSRIQALLKKSPDDPWAWSFLGKIRRDGGDTAGAFEAFRNAASREPSRDTFRDLVALDPVRGLELVLGWTKGTNDDEMLGAVAEMYVMAGRTADARQTLLQAIERDPDDSDWMDRLIAVDPVAATASLERRIAAAAGAASDEVLGHYARALAAAGRKDEAFAQYLAAYRKDPRDVEWKAALAATDPTAAVPILSAHVRDYPADPAGHGAYGAALAAVGRRADAVPEFERALELGEAPRWYEALREVDQDRAIAGLHRRAEAQPRDPELWGYLGGELHRLGRDAEAREAYERAIGEDPANRDWARALRDLPAPTR